MFLAGLGCSPLDWDACDWDACDWDAAPLIVPVAGPGVAPYPPELEEEAPEPEVSREDLLRYLGAGGDQQQLRAIANWGGKTL